MPSSIRSTRITDGVKSFTRALCLAIVGALLFANTGWAIELEPVDRLVIDEVSVSPQHGVELRFRALDLGGKPVQNLRRVDLAFAEDGRAVEVEELSTSERTARSMVFVLDRSRTMTGRPLDAVREAIRQVVADLRNDDRVMLLLVGRRNHIAVDFGDDRDTLHTTLDAVEAEPRATAPLLWDAVAQAHAIAAQEAGAASIVLFTDGRDGGSARPADAAIESPNPRISTHVVAYRGRGDVGLPALETLAGHAGTPLLTLGEGAKLSDEILAAHRFVYRARFQSLLDGSVHRVSVSAEGSSDEAQARYPLVVDATQVASPAPAAELSLRQIVGLMVATALFGGAIRAARRQPLRIPRERRIGATAGGRAITVPLLR